MRSKEVEATKTGSSKSPEYQYPSLRIVLNGQGDGAALLFDKLRENGHNIVGVVATVKKDRDGNIDPLRKKGIDANIPVINLGDVNKNEGKEKLRKVEADLAVGFYLQAILDDEVIQIPTFGTMNTHYSLLPKNRGRDAMNRSILLGEDIGITTFMMNEIIDGGDIVDQRTFSNPDDKSQGALYYKYLPEFVSFVADSVNKMALGIDTYRKNGTPLPVIPQNHSQATEYPPLTNEELEVDFEAETALTINRKMNAGGPGASALIEGEWKKIGKPTRLEGPPLKAGRIVEKTEDQMTIEATQGLIQIGRIQEVAQNLV